MIAPLVVLGWIIWTLIRLAADVHTGAARR